SSVRWAAEAMCSFGITRMWVGLRGAMSRNARTRASSWTLLDGVSPRTSRQRRQSGGSGRTEDSRRWSGERLDPPDDAVADRGVDAVDLDATDVVLERRRARGCVGNQRPVRLVSA